MRIYVAGSSREIERAESTIKRLRALGHTITFDWPAHVRASGGANEGTLEQLRRAAELCAEGARRSELTWVLIPPIDKPTTGAWWEAGVAYENDVRVITSDPPGPKQFCIFLHLSAIDRFVSDEDAFAALSAIADEEGWGPLDPRPSDKSPEGA